VRTVCFFGSTGVKSLLEHFGGPAGLELDGVKNATQCVLS
jgi:hypothetical protein